MMEKLNAISLSIEYDLVIGRFNKLPEGIRRSTLLQEDEVIMVRAGHPLTHSKLTKERLIDFPHLVVTLTGVEGHEANGLMNNERMASRIWIERALHESQGEKIGPAGRTTICVPHFAAMAAFLQLADIRRNQARPCRRPWPSPAKGW